MPWSNGDITLYHGTDDQSARQIMRATPGFLHGVTLGAGKALVDFGQGFYTTTYEHQACNWANLRISRRRNLNAVVLRFTAARDALAQLSDLVFTRDNPDFWDLVMFCRGGTTISPNLHARAGLQPYDLVCGPVTIWPQTLVIKDCDQISFHSPRALGVLSGAQISGTGNPRL